MSAAQVPDARTDRAREELTFEALNEGQTFHVSVDYNGGHQVCEGPVTYDDGCEVADVPRGSAVVHVTGAATFDREIRVGDSGQATVEVGHRSFDWEVISGAMFAAGTGGAVFAWTDSHGFRGGVGDHLGDFFLGIAATGVAVYGLAGFVAGLLSPHNALVVDRPGRPPEVVASTPRRPPVEVTLVPTQGGATGALHVKW